MTRISAFVGHSFADKDKELVIKFLNYFDQLSKITGWFSWDHAEGAEPRSLVEKVKEKAADKNLFIGISTKHEAVLNIEALTEANIDDHKIEFSTNTLEYKTSDWLLQEIGYAVGSNKQILILKEKGLRKPGGIQGTDLEYIEFDRKSVEESFGKIADMLSSLKPPHEIIADDAPQELEEDAGEDTFNVEPEFNYTPQASWDLDDYFRAISMAVIEEKKSVIESIRSTYNSSPFGGTKSQKARFELEILHWENIVHSEDTIQSMIAIHEAHPRDCSINRRVSKVYKKLNDFHKAAECLESAAENASSVEQSLIDFKDAYSLYFDAGEIEECDRIYATVVEQFANLNSENYLLFMAKICAKKGNRYSAQAINERLVEMRPEDHGRRFDLAYQYSDLGENELALLHYQVLSQSRQDPVDWNNLGVSQNRLGHKSKAVISYEIAEGMKYSLAATNLASLYASGGFFKLAETLCSKYLDGSVDNKIIKTMSEIASLKEADDKEIEKAIEKSKTKQNYLLDFEKGIFDSLNHPINGAWLGFDHPIYLEIKEGKLFGISEYEIENALPLSSMLGQIKGAPAKHKLILEGSIVGRSVEYSLSHSEKTTVLGSGAKEGLMVISSDGMSIHCYKTGKWEKDPFFELVKSKG